MTFWRKTSTVVSTCPPMAYVTLMLINYWAWMIKLKSCLEITMPFVVAQWLSKHLTTSLYMCLFDHTVISARIIGLDCYLATQKAWEWSAFDRPQGIRDKVNFTGKMRPAGTDFRGIKFRDFSVPPGHMACMQGVIYIGKCPFHICLADTVYIQKMIIFTTFYYNAFPFACNDLIVDYVYTIWNFVNVYQQKRNVAFYTCNRFTLSC